MRVGTKSEKEKMLQESRKGKNEKKERKKKEREREPMGRWERPPVGFWRFTQSLVCEAEVVYSPYNLETL